MKKNFRSISRLTTFAGGVALALGLSLPAAWADSEDGAAAVSSNNATADQRESRTRAFGLSNNILPIPAAAFTPRSSSTTKTYSGIGYISSATGGQLWAPVRLPAGARVNWVDLYYYDNDTSDIQYWFTGYDGGDFGGNPPGYTDFVSNSTTGTPGYGYTYIAVSPALTINNDVAYSGGYQYSVIVSLPAGSNYRIKGADIWWQRQVSPAPGSATFSDVPTNYWAFQYVEALAASGITSGCGGGNFCPTQAVTRDQMAVFLSKALGLYYPD